MSYVMHRSFAEFMGMDWPKDVAYIQDGKRVTYAEVRERRRQAQAEHLRYVLAVDESGWRAAQVWVFFVPGTIYGGWHLYLRTLKKDWWLKRIWRGEDLTLEVMRLFPCGVLPSPQNFEQWKPAFAKQYRVPGGRRRDAVANGWLWCGNGYRPERFVVKR